MTACPYSYFEYHADNDDTYSALAKKYRVTEKQLRAYNDNLPMSGGSKIKIPYSKGGCSNGAFYAIKKGETLLSISERNDIELTSLLASNPYLNPAYYVAGQVIVIPQRPASKTRSHYTLLQNESLFDVLRKFDMDLNTFCALNPEIDVMNIREHQRVSVTERAGGTLGRWYEICSEDTPSGIAKKFGVKLPRLLAVNENLRPSEFVQGVRIRIPSEQKRKTL